MSSAMAQEDLHIGGEHEPLPILYAFGSNGSGQLGIGHLEDVSEPTPVLGHNMSVDALLVNIACGGNHTIILHGNGQFATTGVNSDGRCLTNISSEATKFAEATISANQQDFPEPTFGHVAATWSSTLAISKRGQTLVGGTGNSGELGLGKDIETADVPTVVRGFPPAGTQVVMIASCMAHVCIVLSNGEVWGWGKGRQGQLGSPAEHKWRPTKIEGIPFFVVHAVCGKDFTCVFGRRSTGELLMLGPNGKDKFGVKAGAPASVPDWKQAAASWGSIFVLLESGELIGWGRDDHGQLPPRSLPSLKSIAAGSEHCLGLTTEEGKLLAWGWGEHGNCGSHTDTNGDVKGCWNELHTPQPAMAVFAGCATSFVVTQGSSRSIG